jgi:hypothetical protein
MKRYTLPSCTRLAMKLIWLSAALAHMNPVVYTRKTARAKFLAKMLDDMSDLYASHTRLPHHTPLPNIWSWNMQFFMFTQTFLVK